MDAIKAIIHVLQGAKVVRDAHNVMAQPTVQADALHASQLIVVRDAHLTILALDAMSHAIVITVALVTGVKSAMAETLV